jgi:hypothetical protein
MAHAPWDPRGAATAVVYMGKIWVMGGLDTEDFVHHSDVWCSEDGIDWQLVADEAPWGQRGMHGSVIFDGSMWVMGGGVYNDAYPNNTVVDYNDVWRSEDGRNWEQVTASAGWGPRRFHSVLVHDHQIWVIAGYARGNLNEVWSSRDGKTWTEVRSDMIWSIRHEPACLSYKGAIWLMGGYGAELYNDIWVLASDQSPVL